MTELQQNYFNTLKNRIYKCLCERENNGEWEACLEAILIEFIGIPNQWKDNNYYKIYYNLSAAKFMDYKYFRKAIFNAMNLLGSESK